MTRHNGSRRWVARPERPASQPPSGRIESDIVGEYHSSEGRGERRATFDHGLGNTELEATRI
ncbi:MAG: hypothetical protein IID46_01840 [Planctomycetes bacterium]|nr:hypothetical protein [Planctomycetota bacterium]